MNKLIIRISRTSMSFTTVNADNPEHPVTYQPYVVKAGISMAANMREALRTVLLLSNDTQGQRVMVMVDAPVLMVPIDLYEEQEKETLYYHAFPDHSPLRSDNGLRNTDSGFNAQRSPLTVLSYVLPNLSCVALYTINRDLKQVLDERFPQASYVCVSAPVWNQLHQRSFTGVRSKLFGYFHDQRLEIISFQQNRFKFYNTFDAQRRADSLYFLLYVWRQLNLQQEHDELHLVGDVPEQDALIDELRQYLKRAYVINPAADYNRSPVTKVVGMPYDLMTLIVKGR